MACMPARCYLLAWHNMPHDIIIARTLSGIVTHASQQQQQQGKLTCKPLCGPSPAPCCAPTPTYVNTCQTAISLAPHTHNLTVLWPVPAACRRRCRRGGRPVQRCHGLPVPLKGTVYGRLPGRLAAAGLGGQPGGRRQSGREVGQALGSRASVRRWYGSGREAGRVPVGGWVGGEGLECVAGGAERGLGRSGLKSMRRLGSFRLLQGMQARLGTLVNSLTCSCWGSARWQRNNAHMEKHCSSPAQGWAPTWGKGWSRSTGCGLGRSLKRPCAYATCSPHMHRHVCKHSSHKKGGGSERLRLAQAAGEGDCARTRAQGRQSQRQHLGEGRVPASHPPPTFCPPSMATAVLLRPRPL